MYLAAPALVAIVGCVLVSEKSDLWGLVVDSANSMAHSFHVTSTSTHVHHLGRPPSFSEFLPAGRLLQRTHCLAEPPSARAMNSECHGRTLSDDVEHVTVQSRQSTGDVCGACAAARATVSQTLWQPALARRSPPDHRRPGSLPQPIHARVVPLVKALQLTPLVGAVCCPARVRHDPVARQVLRSLCAGEGELRPVGEAAGVAWTRQWAGVGRRCSALGRRERWSFKKARQLRLNRD